MPHPQHPAPSIALYTHPAANLERAELVPACCKEGEIEACSFSSQRDSVRAPSMSHAPEISSVVGTSVPSEKTPQCQARNMQFPYLWAGILCPTSCQCTRPATTDKQGQQERSLPQPQASPQLPPDSVHCLIPLPSCPQHPAPESGDTPRSTTAFLCCVLRALPSPWSSRATKSPLRGGWHRKWAAGEFLAAPMCPPMLQALP